MTSVPEFIGWAVIGLLAVAGLAVVLLAVLLLAVRLWPRAHAGRPRNTGELSFRDANGVVQTLVLHRWWGLSDRTRATWWFGLMIYKPDLARTRTVVKRPS